MWFGNNYSGKIGARRIRKIKSSQNVIVRHRLNLNKRENTGSNG